MSRQSELVAPIQDAVFAALRARAALHDVTILKREPKQTSSDIEAAIAQLKLYAFVFPALLLRPNPNQPGPYFEKIQLRVRVAENPVLNDTTLDAYQLVELVHWVLNGLPFTGLTGVNALIPSEPATEPVDDPDLVAFDILYETSAGLTPRPDSP